MLPEKLKNIFKEVKRQSVSDLAFMDEKGGLIKYNAIQSAFNAGFVALKFPWRSTHICRHTYATIALMTTKNIFKSETLVKSILKSKSGVPYGTLEIALKTLK